MKTFDESLKEIMDYANEQGTRDESLLDDEVHDTASSIASTVNNSGFEEQVKFLLTHNGIHDETVDHLKKLLTDTPTKETPRCEDFCCSECGIDLSRPQSIKRTYTSKRDDSKVSGYGHYDKNGDYDPDVKADLSNGSYDLVEGSDTCSNCENTVG